MTLSRHLSDAIFTLTYIYYSGGVAGSLVVGLISIHVSKFMKSDLVSKPKL